MKVLLAHTPQMRSDYYGERSLSGLRAVADVRLHEGDTALDAASLIEAARAVDIIVANRMTQGPSEIFAKLPALHALVRCAVEKRIAGGAMDVGRALDQMPSPELARRPNVIATPHVGGLTPQAIEHQSAETVRQVAAVIKREAPIGAVNAGHWIRRPRVKETS